MDRAPGLANEELGLKACPPPHTEGHKRGWIWEGRGWSGVDDVLIYVESHTKYEDLNNLPPTPARRKNHVTSEALHGETEDHCLGGARKRTVV